MSGSRLNIGSSAAIGSALQDSKLAAPDPIRKKIYEHCQKVAGELDEKKGLMAKYFHVSPGCNLFLMSSAEYKELEDCKVSNLNQLFLYKDENDKVFYRVKGNAEKQYIDSGLFPENTLFNQPAMNPAKYDNEAVSKAVLQVTSKNHHTLATTIPDEKKVREQENVDKESRKVFLEKKDGEEVSHAFAEFYDKLITILHKMNSEKDASGYLIDDIASIGLPAAPPGSNIVDYTKYETPNARAFRECIEKLNEIGFYNANGRPICFWSGSKAMDKANSWCDLFLMSPPAEKNEYKVSDKNHLYLYEDLKNGGYFYRIEINNKLYDFSYPDTDKLQKLVKQYNQTFDQPENEPVKCESVELCETFLSVAAKRHHTHEYSPTLSDSTIPAISILSALGSALKETDRELSDKVFKADSALFATQARGNVPIYSSTGNINEKKPMLTLHNFNFNNELPIAQRLRREGQVYTIELVYYNLADHEWLEGVDIQKVDLVKRRLSAELPAAMVEKILANDLSSPASLTQSRQPSISISPPSLDPDPSRNSSPSPGSSDPSNMLSPPPLSRNSSGSLSPASPRLNRVPSAAEKKEGTEMWLHDPNTPRRMTVNSEKIQEIYQHWEVVSKICKLFLMAPPEKNDTPKISTMNDLYLYEKAKPELGLFYLIQVNNAIREVQLPDVNYQSLATRAEELGLKFDQPKENPKVCQHNDFCQTVLFITSEKGDTHPAEDKALSQQAILLLLVESIKNYVKLNPAQNMVDNPSLTTNSSVNAQPAGTNTDPKNNVRPT